MQFSPSYCSHKFSHFIAHLIFHLQLNHCMGQIKRQMSLKWTIWIRSMCKSWCATACMHRFLQLFLFSRMYVHNTHFIERMQVKIGKKVHSKKIYKEEKSDNISYHQAFISYMSCINLHDISLVQQEEEEESHGRASSRVLHSFRKMGGKNKPCNSIEWRNGRKDGKLQSVMQRRRSEFKMHSHSSNYVVH